MIYRIFPSKDTFITDVKKSAVPQTGSNFGASEILDLFKVSGVSGTTGYAASSSISRLLIQWDLSELASLTASGKAPSTGSTYNLKLFDARHSGKMPTSFDIEIAPLTTAWDEGRGLDNDTYLDLGAANWDKATTTTWWTSTGSDFSTTNTASYSFSLGNENVDVDISSIVGAWLTGSLVNNGLMIRFTNTEELNSTNYYHKKFHGRETSFFDKKPTIEMKWDDSIKDDRATFLFGVSSSLYLYNKQRGQLTNISGVGTSGQVLSVAINDLSGTIQNVSASHTGLTGIYSASIVLATGSHSGSAFSDRWHLNGATYMTGAFTPHNDGPFSSNNQQQYIVSIKNLKKNYENSELVRFNLFVRTRNYNPAVVLTGSLTLNNTIIEKGYYRIDNFTTGKEVIPLGTGTIETTRLSYDQNGNYFNFHMNTLAKKELYNIVFFFQIDGQLQKINQDFKFKLI